jgi:uncharacterized protein (TIGR01244 family)
MQRHDIRPNIAIADQPTTEELTQLKQEGFVGVVNLRNDGEPEQPLSTAAEGDVVRQNGLDYLNYGVGGTPLSTEGVEEVCDFLDRHADGKVLVHCKKGARAAALVLLYLARKGNWPANEVFQRGQAHGIHLEGGLRQLVQIYLDQHP